MSPTHVPSEGRKWQVACIFLVGYGALCAMYLILPLGMSGVTLAFWSSWTAATAGFMLATSFVASSLSYFVGWPNMKLGYQKQIGIVAFWLCFAYCLTLLFLDPDIYWYGFGENLLTPNFILGLSAMAIFALMVMINSHFIGPLVSWPTISLFLNLGYFGYALLVMRAILLEWPLWVEWLTTLNSLPTNRFILSVLAVFVLLLRLAVIIDRRIRK